MVKPSALDTKQLIAVLKVALYVGVSAAIDVLISALTDMDFGVLTPIINVALVALKKVFTPVEQ